MSSCWLWRLLTDRPNNLPLLWWRVATAPGSYEQIHEHLSQIDARVATCATLDQVRA